jgi:hypothetical protein
LIGFSGYTAKLELAATVKEAAIMIRRLSAAMDGNFI